MIQHSTLNSIEGYQLSHFYNVVSGIW